MTAATGPARIRMAASCVVACGALMLPGCDSGGPAGPSAPEAQAGEPEEASTPEGAGSDPLLDKTFDDLKFDIEPGDPFERGMLTDNIREMFGDRIRIRGYIFPTARKRLKQFVLVRDNQECCFGPGAALYDCILVDMQPDTIAEFSVRPVTVEGRLDLNEVIGPDGMHLAIYHLRGENVR